MGLGPKISSSRYDSLPYMATPGYRPKAPNPDPSNYRITSSQMVLGHLILAVNYPDARSYEGNKILFFKDTKLADIRKQKDLDPHFTNNKNVISPFARFEPTQAGWDAAILLAKALG